MASDIYTRSGMPVAFHDHNLIYDLHGRAVGQLRGSHAYCMAGHYVGELQNGIILDKNRRYGSIGAYAGTRGQRKIGCPRRTRGQAPRPL
jgi:hypothetical protein